MFSLDTLQALFPNLARLRPIDVACAFGAIYAFLKIAQVARRRLNTTALLGPPNPSYMWGLDGTVSNFQDPGSVYEKWAEEYDGAYEVPLLLGGKNIVLCDPKAVAHFYGGGESTYIIPRSTKVGTENLFGKGIFTAEGETHRRQRKTLTPAFTNASVRSLTSVFYDSAYKAKGVWDSVIESNGGRTSAMIEVQSCMNHVSLDTVGIAGFSHDFGSLDGKPAEVAEVFDAFGSARRNVDLTIFVLAQAFPFLLNFPTPLSKITSRLNHTMEEISNELFRRSRKQKVEVGTWEEKGEKSVLGLLLKAESQTSQLHLTRDEVTAQVKALLLAGYETTSISLTWALIELSRNPDIQTKLREELFAFGTDPTYDQLSNGLPYLDAVVHETLRMYPPLIEYRRMATKDDVIPLSKPVRTRSGRLVDHISVAKGTCVYVSIMSMNRSTALWGPDAKGFKPERWIAQDGIPGGAMEVQGHRHLLTFLDGPRMCIGKGFAIAEIKIVLSVLVKNFVFELRDGPETAIEMVPGLLFRPRVVGEQGTAVPLLIRRFE